MLKKIKEFTLKTVEMMRNIIIAFIIIVRGFICKRKDQKTVSEFINGTKMNMEDFYRMTLKFTARKFWKYISFSYNLFPETYKVECASDVCNNCTWVFVRYLGSLGIDISKYFSGKYISGYVYKIDYITKEEIDQFVSNTGDIESLSNLLNVIDLEGYLKREYRGKDSEAVKTA